MSEEWRPVVGYEGKYEISSLGRIRSLWCKQGPRRNPLYMKPKTYSKYGHLRIQLWFDGESTEHMVHRLVLGAFVGPCPPNKECAHLNGNPTDNQVGNLAWVSRKENQRQKVEHGTSLRGERHPANKLNRTDVEDIRMRAASGESRAAMAREYGITPGHLRKVIRGAVWPHVPLRRPKIPEFPISSEMVKSLRRRVGAGETCSAVARDLGISVGHACRIVRGEARTSSDDQGT